MQTHQGAQLAEPGRRESAALESGPFRVVAFLVVAKHLTKATLGRSGLLRLT